MHPTAFTWHETDPARPAQEVHIRLLAYDNPEITHPLRHAGDGVWTGVVDLPDGLRSSYQICPVRETARTWEEIIATGVPDPASENTIGPVYGNSNRASIVECPDSPAQPFHRRRQDVRHGEVRSLSTDRDWPVDVHVYRPSAPGPLPTAVLFDAQAWMSLDVTATFDNLIADGLVQPFLSLLIGYPFGPPRVHGLTTPGVHLPYLLDELMPWAVAELHATTDPSDTVLIGQSLGGLAAVATALAAPHRFGNVISQSGSFWWSSERDDQLSGASVIASIDERKPVRFWLEAGSLEDTLVTGNRELHTTLTKHNFYATYREYQGGHDFACWRGGLADGLIAMLPSGEDR